MAFIEDAAELLLKHQGLQALNALDQRCFLVGFTKKGGIGQARSNNLFIAGNHQRGVAAVDIGNKDKIGLDRTLGIDGREIFLVFFHRRHQRLGRHVEKTRFKLTD